MVTGEIIKIDTDDNGAIRVWSNYKVDGVDVPSQYPKINGKSVFCTRYSVVNFAGLDKATIQALVTKDVDAYANKLAIDQYSSVATPVSIADNLTELIGTTVTKTDGVLTVGDKEATFKPDGTVTIKAVQAVVEEL
jgi:hypothetical protein